MHLTRRHLLAGGAAAAATTVTGRWPALAAPTDFGPSCPADATKPAVIYSTDLNHPFGDLDDHIDLAVMHTLDVDVRLLLLDRHPRNGGGTGLTPAAQLENITGRHWRTVEGLPDLLPTLNRAASTAIVDVLRESDTPVTIVAVGSLRDVAAAHNADRDLFREKVRRVVVFAGDASAPYVEYNITLDPLAFLTVMTSGVPIRWVPCFDGGVWQAGTRSSFTQYPYGDVFPADLSAKLQRFFTYRLRSIGSDPIAWTNGPVEPADRAVLTTDLRNLWCAGLLGPVIDDGVMRRGTATVGVFEPTTVRWNLAGMVDPTGQFEATVDLWRVVDAAGWRAAMLEQTVAALRTIR